MLYYYAHVFIVQGYKHCRAYIAEQGPLQNTVNDFWRMVWEHHCSCIVLLCDTEENDIVDISRKIVLSLCYDCILVELYMK